MATDSTVAHRIELAIQLWMEMDHEDQWQTLLEFGPTTRLAMRFLRELRYSVNHSNKWEMMRAKYWREYGRLADPMLVRERVL